MTELSDDTLNVLRRASISAIGNALLVDGFRNVWLRSLAPVKWHGGGNMVGRAYTLRFIPAREDINSLATYADRENKHRRAIEECPEDCVLVISTGGEIGGASAGDLMIERLKARGCAGIVTDGGFRDTPDITKIDFPAYQLANAPLASPIKLHAADLDVPIGCGGVAIYPGDLIVGDAAGVVAIPAGYEDVVAKRVQAGADYEEFAQQEIRKGRSIMDVFPATEQSQREYEEWKRNR